MTPPPWLLWGGQATLVMARPTGAGSFQQISQQLARVSYGRPDTWSFLLGYKVTASDLVGAPYVVQVGFDLTIGIGRAMTTLVQFGFFQSQNPSATSPIQWATRVPTPQMVFSDNTTIEQCDHFPAQDLQVQATVVASGVTAGTGITVELFTYFAPRTHNRPEWYSNDPRDQQYRGNEQKGS